MQGFTRIGSFELNGKRASSYTYFLSVEEEIGGNVMKVDCMVLGQLPTGNNPPTG